MEWVYIYLTLVKNVPVVSVGKDNYKTEQECQLANTGRDENPFWCVPRNFGWMKAKDELCERS